MATTNQTPQTQANNSTPTSLISIDKSAISTSPFFSVDDIERFRPFNSFMEQQDASTATIILTQRVSAPQESNLAKDYFKDFSAKITDLLPSSSTGNQIPELNLVTGDVGAGDPYRSFYGVFRNFSLLQYSESRSEIAKVALNFGLKWNAYFFGSKPRVYQFGGFFLDSKDYPYYEQFMRAYDNYLAGGQCVSKGFRMYMVYDNKITSGWMLGIEVSGNSENYLSRTFSFQLLVDDENWFRTNWLYDVDGSVIDYSSRELSNTYQLPGVAQ